MRLHVGGKTRVFGGAQIDWFRTTVHHRANPILARFDLHTHVAQFVQGRIHDAWIHVGQANVAARRCDRTQERAGLDAIRHDFMRYAVQTLYPVNHQTVCADAADFRAHFHQHIGQVGDFWLACGVFQHGLSVCQRCRHQQVFCAGHGNHVGGDACTTFQAPTRTVFAGRFAFFIENRCLCMDVAVFNIDASAHRLQPFDVLIDRTRANRAATRQ